MSHRNPQSRVATPGAIVYGMFASVRRGSRWGLALVLAACSDGTTALRTPEPVHVARGARRAIVPNPDGAFGVVSHTFQDKNLQTQTGAQIGDMLDAVEASGATWVRMTLYWSTVQANGPDEFAVWGYDFDMAVRAAHARGLSVVVTIAGTPRWASSSGNISGGVRADRLNDWRQFARRLEATYSGVVSMWILGNEVNCVPASNDLQTTGLYSGTPAEYDAQFRIAAEEFGVGRVMPGSPTFMEASPGQTCVAADAWIRDRVQSVGPLFTTVAVHDYSDSLPDRILANVARAKTAAGPDRKVWLTEYGLNAPATNRTRDRNNVRVLYGVLRATGTSSGPAKSFYYRLWSEHPSDSLITLLSPSWSGSSYPRRDSWHVFRHVAGGGGGEWQPVVRWNRPGDHMFSTDPTEGNVGGYSLESSNAWSTSWHQFSFGGVRMHPLFRCEYADASSNGAHYITQYWNCTEPGERAATMTIPYGFVADYPIPEIGMTAPLYRFKNLRTSDYLTTTNEAEATNLRSLSSYNAGWQQLPVQGYAWPAGYRPRPLSASGGPVF